VGKQAILGYNRGMGLLGLSLALWMAAASADAAPAETEVKIGLDCSDFERLQVVKEPKTDHLTFFEKRGLPFLKAGVILRKRTGDHNDVTVKFRPRTPTAENPPAGPGIESEGDWTLKSRVTTWSFKVEGRQFTREQLAWLARLTPEKPDARNRVEIESERWKWEQEGKKISLERWSRTRETGGACMTLEVSARVETARAEATLAALQRFIAAKGIRIRPELQENKTGRVLNLLIGRVR
jgi:hypothetical protein